MQLFYCDFVARKEVSHRTLKGPLQPGYQKRGVGDLMVDVCETMQTRLEKGDYTHMCCSVTDPWKELMHCQRKRMAELDVPESEQKQKANRHKPGFFWWA